MALGHGAQGVARPDRRGGRGGRLEAVGEPDVVCQADALGAPGEHRLGAEVDLGAGDLAGHELAAEPLGGLQQGDPQAGSEEPVGGGETGDATADDDDVSGVRVRAVY